MRTDKEVKLELQSHHFVAGYIKSTLTLFKHILFCGSMFCIPKKNTVTRANDKFFSRKIQNKIYDIFEHCSSAEVVGLVAATLKFEVKNKTLHEHKYE